MKNITLLLLMLFSCSAFMFAQQDIQVTGTVTDGDGNPLPGASIILKGTLTGTETDFDGNYTLEGLPSNGTLVVSYIGFTTIEELINGRTTINFKLSEDAQALDEVVVVGYGTAQKKDLTGSITSIKSEDILQQPALTPAQSLQGKASGLQIIGSAAPGSSPVVRIRGTGTVLAGRNPIYVVDGIITDRIDNINSDDIVKMDILKDASSLAIYGSRGANGVIIITTKSGKDGKLSIDLSTYYGVKSVLSKVKMADAASFAKYSNVAFGYSRFSTSATYDTDWFDAITRMGSVMNQNISITGGSEKIKAFFSANYYEEEGILKGNDFNRLNLRNKVSYNLTPKLKFEHSISVSLNKYIPKPQGAFNIAYRQSPLVPVKYVGGAYDGRWGVPFDDAGASYNNVGNPVAAIELNNEKQKNTILQGNINGEYQILEGLKFNSSFGIESGFGKAYNFIDKLALFLAGDPSRISDDFSAQEPFTTLTSEKSNYYNWVFDAYVTYDKTFNDYHNLKFTVGTSSTERQNDKIKVNINNVPANADLFSLQNGEQGTESLNFDDTKLSNKDRLRSYFARLQYNFAQKYFITGTIRRDGSSIFANKDKNWGNFPSVGIGWTLSEEPFLKDNNFIDLIKLRASWGELGNQNIPFNAITFDSNLNAVFGSDQAVNPGSTITAIVDENVSWEVTDEIDFGFEFSFMDGKLTGEADYYNRLNKNAILPISLPKAFGAENNVLTHAGKVRNKGVEIALNWNNSVNEDFKYHFGGNVTFNDNKLEKITNPFAFEQTGGSLDNGQVTKRLREGQPIGSFYLLEVLGFDERGEFVYKDVNGDGEIDDADKQFFGSIQPKMFYGVNFGFDYKNWDFNVDGYGNVGNKVYNGKKAQRWGGENIEQRVAEDFFIPGNTASENPAPFNDVPLASTYYLEDGDFFRINTLTDIFKGVQKIRFYALAQNPIIFKKFTGFTPELIGNDGGNPLGTAGIELNAYPSVKSYMFGINVNF